MSRFVKGRINYIGAMTVRPRYYAQDHSRDNLVFDSRTVRIENLRGAAEQPALAREGFALVPHKSKVADFRDAEAVSRIHLREIEELVRTCPHQYLWGYNRYKVPAGAPLPPAGPEASP